jgi:hypothetical protein
MPHKFIQGEKENTSKTITRKYAILESKRRISFLNFSIHGGAWLRSCDTFPHFLSYN